MPEEQKDRGQEEQSPSHVSLRFSSVLTFVFLSTAAIVLAYIAGVMMGRHGEQETSSVKEQKRQEAVLKMPQEEKFSILLPEDLDYARVLRNEKVRERDKDNSSQKQENSDKEEQAQAQKSNAGQKSDAQDGQNAAHEAAAAPVEKKPEQDQQALRDKMFDHVFQLGAFRDEDTVDALRQKLEGRGFRTRMQKDGKLFLVLVLLRGNAERAAEVTAVARDMNLGEPILRSKKEVPE